MGLRANFGLFHGYSFGHLEAKSPYNTLYKRKSARLPALFLYSAATLTQRVVIRNGPTKAHLQRPFFFLGIKFSPPLRPDKVVDRAKARPRIASMDLVAILVNLIVGGLFCYAVWVLLNWITGMIAIPAPLKTVVMIIFAILVILWLVGALGIPRITFGSRASVTIR